MHDDRTAAECLHSIAENITGSCLYDVLNKFWTVGIESFPLLGATDAFIGDTLATKLIGSNLRFYICQLSSWWESNKEHATPAGEGQSIFGSCVFELYGFHDSMINVPPEFHDVRIRLSPCIYQRMEFFFGEPHIQSAHCFQGSDWTSIAKRQLCDFPFLTQMSIDAVFLHRDLEHLRCRGAVDISAFGEDILTPFFTGKPCNDTGLNSRKVSHQKLCTFSGNKSSTNELGKGIWHVFIEKFHSFKVARAYQRASLCKVWKMILR